MNILKTAGAPAQEKKLSLDVFKDKMMTEVQEDKGGLSSIICTYLFTKAFEAGVEIGEGLVDDCHD